jgi:hypothetical protein
MYLRSSRFEEEYDPGAKMEEFNIVTIVIQVFSAVLVAPFVGFFIASRTKKQEIEQEKAREEHRNLIDRGDKNRSLRLV